MGQGQQGQTVILGMGQVSADQVPNVLLSERAFVGPVLIWVKVSGALTDYLDEAKAQRYDAVAKAPSEALFLE